MKGPRTETLDGEDAAGLGLRLAIYAPNPSQDSRKNSGVCAWHALMQSHGLKVSSSEEPSTPRKVGG